MPDISMCSSEQCPIKNKCYRYMAEPNEHWQSYSNFYTEIEPCSHYTPILLSDRSRKDD